MNKNVGIVLIASGFVVVIALLLWIKFTTPRIAYVRSGKIVEGYFGMKESRKQFENRVVEWQSNIDTLTNNFQKNLNTYNHEVTKLSETEKKRRENLLEMEQAKVEQYQQAIEKKAEDEEKKMLQGALNQINSYIEDYAASHGYDMVFGVTLSGNILYGKESIDITEEILNGINKAYKK